MASTDGIESVISEQIKTLIRIKADIASAIVSLGGSVSNNDTFASYADKIRNLDPKKNLDLGTLNITSNGSYSASAEGMDGFSSVTVNVTDTSGGGSGGSGSGGSGSGGSGGSGDGSYEEDLPVYIVTFTNPEDPNFENVEVEVKYGGDAEYTGPTPTKEGNYKFRFFEPLPINVQSDMTCKAVFRNLDAEITDLWPEIVSNKGANYEIGEYKRLPLGKIRTREINSTTANSSYGKPASECSFNVMYDTKVSGEVYMMKVAENEDGSTSTWLACSPLQTDKLRSGYLCLITYPWRFITNLSSVAETVTSYGIKYKEGIEPMNWKDSDLYKWLNDEDGSKNGVLAAIDPIIRNAIVPVHKSSHGYEASTGSDALAGKDSTDKLWLPSYSEIVRPTASDINERGNIDYRANGADPYLTFKNGTPNYNSYGYRLRSLTPKNLFYQRCYQKAYNNNYGHESNAIDGLTGNSSDGTAIGIRFGFCL